MIENRSVSADRKNVVIPKILGVLNVTPDSFSDGGRWVSVDRALERVLEMVHQGADAIDIGGESTRPGAAEVPAAAEIDRTATIVEAISKRFRNLLCRHVAVGYW